MKIVCESCGAKYSIADERVTGKMFKIRCKRCSEVIVVRGDQPTHQAAEANGAGAQSQAAIWHAVVEGDQAGPFSPTQLGEMLTSGTVDWDAYVWTEGFENWLPMRDVPDLVAQITGQPQQANAAVAAQAYRPGTQTLTGQPSMGADPFADDAAPSEAGLFGGGQGNGGGQDLFARGGGMGASPFGAEEPGVLASSPSPRMTAERAMTGARNENSVLFSLKNLQQLATGSATPAAPQVAMAAGGAAAAVAGEGSGLIDIRALATTTGVGDAGSGSGHRDELLSIGSQGGAFGTLGSPMLSPMGGEDGDGNKKTVVWALVAGVGLVSAAVVAAAYILRSPAQTPAASSVAVAPQTVATAPLAQIQQPVAAIPAAAAAVAPSEGELAAKRAAEEDKAREADKSASAKGSSSGSDHHHKHESASSKGSDSNESTPVAAAQPERKASPPKGGPRTIDDLLDGALNSGSSQKNAHAESAPASNLPATPSRDDAMAAMNGVKPAVQACAKGVGGVALVKVNVAGASGRVTTAEVSGVTGPAGSCIAQAVRKAQFPKFTSRVFALSFPYKL